uniref:Uncharacterized protein n=1 Tax=Oryza nivara TaxID=4536 RepID=A0A0E0J2G8_ORYNI
MDRDKAKALLQKIRGVDDELDEIVAANAATAQRENGLWLADPIDEEPWRRDLAPAPSATAIVAAWGRPSCSPIVAATALVIRHRCRRLIARRRCRLAARLPPLPPASSPPVGCAASERRRGREVERGGEEEANM